MASAEEMGIRISYVTTLKDGREVCEVALTGHFKAHCHPAHPKATLAEQLLDSETYILQHGVLEVDIAPPDATREEQWVTHRLDANSPTITILPGWNHRGQALTDSAKFLIVAMPDHLPGRSDKPRIRLWKQG